MRRRRTVSPQQQTWIAVQRQLRDSLVGLLADGPDAVLSEQEADFLADHLADDLMSLGLTMTAEPEGLALDAGPGGGAST